MNKVAKFRIHQGAKTPQKQQWEENLREKILLKKQIRADSVKDLENFSKDLEQMSLVVDSIQGNYQALLSENNRLKTTLLELVDECYCWKGNRCDKCLKILNSLATESVEKKSNSTQQYEDLLQRLRKLG
ncbi:MAG: hypothetical protein WBA93_02875 [Microcoleaceae cyanobacterium]